MKPHRVLSKSISSILLLGAAVTLPTVPSAQAANIWDGGGTTDFWSDVFNWDDDAFPGYGTLTFQGATRTTNIVDANINMNMLLWTGSSAWTLNNSGGAVISLFDNGGTQAKVENQSTGLVTINAPITFAATAGNNWGEINAVNGGLTFGTGTLTVNGSGVNGIRMFGAGQTTIFNNTVSASGKYFATTAAAAGTVEVGGSFTSGDIYLMNGSTLKLNSGGSITTSGLRLGGDFGTTGTQNLTLGATFQLTDLAGGQTFGSNINSVTGNTSGSLLVDSLNTSGTNTLSGSIFLDSPLRIQVASGGTVAATGVVSNGSSLTKQGAGTLTLSNTNTYTGGTTLAAGTLNVNSAGAIGNTATGALTITGGTLDNTSGGALTTTAAKAMNWNGDFTFQGTNNLSTNLGAVTVGGTAGQRTVNIAGGTLSTGLINAGAGFGLTKTGAGTLFMASTANTSSVAGLLDVQAGTLQVAGDFTANGGLQGAGTIENGGAASKWFFVNSPTDTTFSGTIRDNPNNAAVRLGLVKRGTGTLHLTGASNMTTDRFAIENGTIRITGTYTAGFGTGGNQNALIGSVANQNGQLIIDGGTFNANKTNNPSLAVSSGANTRGFLRMTSGTINTVAQMNIGNGSGAVGTRAFGAFTMSGGTVNSGSWLVVGANFDRAVLNQSGGTINVNANRMTIGAGGNESLGVVTLSGGSFNVAAGGNTGIFLGENGAGVMTLSGSAAVTLNTNGGATSGTMQFAGNASSLSGHLNLNGGTLTTFAVTKGSSTAGGIYRLNFAGGTLRANANNATFLADLANTLAYVNPGGAIIDSNGFNITVSEPLLAPTASGVSSIAVATGGAGYLDTPVVTLTGGTGTGATAIANVAGGVVTGFTITNPGVGYGAADVLTATLFGGGASTAATVGAITLAANTSTGGFTKTGAGTLTMSSTTNTYGGATTINGGTLSIASIGNGGAASSLGASSSAASNLVLNNGTLAFTGASGSTDRGFTLGTGATGTIDVATGGTLAASGGSAATNGSLTKTGAGILSLTGANLHTGTTTVSAGVLGATGSLLGPVSVGGGQLNALHNAVGTLSVPSLTFAGSGGADFDFGAGNDVITISTAGALTLGTGSALNLYNAGGVTPFTTNGTYTLFDYNTSFAGTLNGAFVVANSQPGKVYSIADNLGATTIELTIGTAVTTEWQTGNGLWSVNANWTAGSPNSIGATATFAALGTPPATVTVDGPQTVGNIVLNHANSYTLAGGATDVITLNNGIGTATISAVTGSHSVNAPVVLVNPSNVNADAGATLTIGGDISGSVGLTKTGAGTVILGGTNSFTTTTISLGTLQIGASPTGTLGTGAVTIGSGATLQFNRSNAYSVANNISGAGGTVTQIGSGTTTLTGSVTHTGATSVTGGTLINEGTINGTTALNVNGGTATLQASSSTTVAGATNVASTANGTLNVLGNAGAAFNGAVSIGTGSGFTGALTINTTGTVTTNADFHAGNGAGSTGTVQIDGGTLTQTAGAIRIGRNGGTGGYTQTGGAVVTPGMFLGVDGTGSVGNGTLSGGSITTSGEFWLSNGAGNSSNFTVSNAGALSSGNWLVVGRLGGTGVLNLSGGSVTKGGGSGTHFIVGSLAGTGTLNQTGGAVNVTAGDFRMGENNGTAPALNGLWDMDAGTATLSGALIIGWRSSQATMDVSGTSTVTAARLAVAAETSNNTINVAPIVNGGPVGTLNQTGGTITLTGGDSRIGGDNSAASVGAQGFVNVSGGTLNFGGNVQIGAFGQGTMTISGTGAVNSTAGFPSVGRFAGGVGILNVSGGTFTQSNAANFLVVGEEGTGTMTVSGTGLVDVQNLRLGHLATGNGTVNLNGGTLATAFVQKTVAGSTALFNFNGGTLRAKANSADFFTGFSSAQLDVQAGGAVIDTNGFSDTITQGLNGTGGLTKQGAGTLTLTGASGFTGATTVTGGTLEAGATNSLGGTSNVTIATGGTLLLSGAGTDRINDAATIGMGGGTIAFNGNVTEGSSPGTGALTLTLNSVIDFANGNSIINFGDSFTSTWTAGTLLRIYNWDGILVAGGGNDQLKFGSNSTSLTAAQLSQVEFYSGANTGFLGTAAYATSFNGELVPVPEPSTVAAAFCLLGLAGLRKRRRA